jgi:hypothetical protein
MKGILALYVLLNWTKEMQYPQKKPQVAQRTQHCSTCGSNYKNEPQIT